MKMSKSFLVVPFLILFSCTKEKSPPELLLSEIIVGTWEKREQWGFPYLDNEWYVFDEVLLSIEFEEDDSLTFYSKNGNVTPGTYEVVDSLNIIHVTTNVSFIWQISEFSRDTFVIDANTDEGLSRSKYVRVE